MGLFESFKRMLGILPPEPRVVGPEQRAQILADMKDYTREALARGETVSEARASSLDIFSGELPDEELASELDALLPALAREREAEMAGWPEITDCDRLDAAFADLRGTGLLAEQNYWCCGTCATSDMGARLKEARKAGGDVPRGYTYYHEQDTESAIYGGGLYLAYGAEARGKEATLGIAREVVTVLERHGFKPDWEGDPDRRIFVPLDWKRRTPLPKAY